MLLILESCNKANKSQENVTQTSANVKDSLTFKRGYSDVNGIKMYYEIYGKGSPLVLIHGGGSTIQTTFGRVIPQLARDRQVIAVELQAHGRTSDRSADLTFEQDADDVAALLKNIGIDKADFFGLATAVRPPCKLPFAIPK